MRSVHHLELFFWRGQNTELSWAVVSQVHWPQARQAEPRRLLAPLRDATPDSALRYLRYILSFTEFDYYTIN